MDHSVFSFALSRSYSATHGYIQLKIITTQGWKGTIEDGSMSTKEMSCAK